MNKDKDFLGTEPVGKLMFRLALPTITAQLINMLYNIIDRIYIGHIPGNGALALTGVGVCMPLIMIISAFAALVGGGGAPHASIAMGKNDLNTAEHILGNCFFLQILISIILTVILLFGNRTFLLAFGASENTIEYAVNYMNIYAVRHYFRPAYPWHEYVYHHTGFCQNRYALCSDRSSDEHCSGSAVYLCIPSGCQRCCACHNSVTGSLLHLGSFFPLRKKDDPAHPEKESHPETGDYSSLCRSRACHIYHAG